jgi:hypothetical protein
MKLRNGKTYIYHKYEFNGDYKIDEVKYKEISFLPIKPIYTTVFMDEPNKEKYSKDLDLTYVKKINVEPESSFSFYKCLEIIKMKAKEIIFDTPEYSEVKTIEDSDDEEMFMFDNIERGFGPKIDLV